MRKLRNIFAIVLCVILTCACAVAEGREFRLSDIMLQIEDMALDLSGIDLIVDAGEDQGSSGAVIALETASGRALDIAATLDGTDLVLTSDGLSKSYKINIADAGAAGTGLDINGLISSFSEEDIAKLSELGMQAITMVQESFQDGGTVDYEGNTYQRYDFALTSEQVQTLLLGGADFLDAHPEIVQLLGVDSVRSAIESAALDLAIEGSVYLSDAGIMADVYLKGGVNALLHFDFTTVSDAETGEDKILVTFTAGEQEGEEYPVAFEISGCIAAKDGMPCYAEFYAGKPDEDVDEGIFIKFYMPEYQADGKVELLINTTDNSVCVDVLIGQTEAGGLDISADITAGANKIVVTFAEGEEAGAIEINASVGGATFDLKANVSSDAVADGWLPAEKECVDILNMGEEDLALLQNEGLSLLLKVLGQLGQANQTVSALVGGLMG